MNEYIVISHINKGILYDASTGEEIMVLEDMELKGLDTTKHESLGEGITKGERYDR